MFVAICPGCGQYQTKKSVIVNGDKGVSTCCACGHQHAFRAMPLYVVLGASGTGKSTLALHLQSTQQEIIALDGDLLWRAEFNAQGNAAFFSMWMNLALNIAQTGKPVMLFTGGLPEDFLKNDCAKYFSSVTVIGLCAEEKDMVARLKARPAWRGSAQEAFIDSMRAYNAKVMQHDLTLNTTGKTVAQCAAELVRIAGHSYKNCR